MQFSTLAEQDFQIFLAYVQMTGGGFYQNFHMYYFLSLPLRAFFMVVRPHITAY
jgi:hypothetical protein